MYMNSNGFMFELIWRFTFSPSLICSEKGARDYEKLLLWNHIE